MQLRLYTTTLVLVLIASAVAGALVSWHREADALVSAVAGGRSTITQWCNDGFVISVTPPRPGEFKIQWGLTQIYAYYSFTGSWVVGGASYGGQCCTGKVCRPVQHTMLLVGTSY